MCSHDLFQIHDKIVYQNVIDWFCFKWIPQIEEKIDTFGQHYLDVRNLVDLGWIFWHDDPHVSGASLTSIFSDCAVDDHTSKTQVFRQNML